MAEEVWSDGSPTEVVDMGDEGRDGLGERVVSDRGQPLEVPLSVGSQDDRAGSSNLGPASGIVGGSGAPPGDAFRDSSAQRVALAVDNILDSVPQEHRQVMAFPWEVNPFLRFIFNPPSFPPEALPPLRFPPHLVTQPPPPIRVCTPSGLSATVGRSKRPRAMNWRSQVDEARQAVVLAWLRLIRGRELLSRVGKQIRDLPEEDQKVQVLLDTFADKATNTLRMRSLDFTKFVAWLTEGGTDKEIIHEATVYQYVCSLRANSRARTAPSRFCQSLSFVHHVLGWEVEEGALQSRRISGVATECISSMAQVRRSEPFPPEFLAFLEKDLMDDQNKISLRYYSGVVLFLIFSRCRFSDAQRIHVEPKVHDQFFVATIKNHKTSRAKGRRGMALEVVGPRVGISGAEWALEWLKVRSTLGIACCLSACSLHAGIVRREGDLSSGDPSGSDGGYPPAVDQG